MRVLIVKLSSLGDVLTAMPAVGNVKAGLKDAEVHWVTQPEYVDLVRLCPAVSRVIAFPRHHWIAQARFFLHELWVDHYDIVIDLQGLFKSGLVTGLARAARRIGPSFYREGARLFYSEVAGTRNLDRHAADQCLDVVRHLGLPLRPTVAGLAVPDRGRPDRALRVALSPCSRWHSKNWPTPRFMKLADELVHEGVTVLLVGSSSDVDAARQVAEAVPAVQNLVGTTSLVELASVLKGVDLLVSNDSGPMHLAAAVGTPVLALFGPTDPRRTGPYGPGHRVLTASMDCRPCRKRSCVNSPTCMEMIRTEDVLSSVHEMLAENSSVDVETE